jgi:1-deoxy-D-xylulose-5-phosphate reductoisomerase
MVTDRPSSGPRDVVVLGSTGSIGQQTLDVIRDHPDLFAVGGLAAGGHSVRRLAEQVAEFRPAVVALADPARVAQFDDELVRVNRAGGTNVRSAVLSGPDAAADIVGAGDIVLNAIAGAAGLDATIAALDGGRRLALANKESLIIGGELVIGRAKPGQIRPVDSEHCALSQCLRAGRPSEVSRIVITASGGPFRGRKRDELGDVTAEQALAHPTWSMGPLITTNSATLVNKGLEVIEAHLLFGIDYDAIEVVAHPQSIVHSMVEYADGSTIAQVSPPDMRLAIAYALGGADRIPGVAAAMDWTRPSTWTFEPIDHATFPAIRLAVEAGRRGGTAPAIYNAANEELVGAFLAGELSFLEIVDTIAVVMADEDVPSIAEPLTRDDVLGADAWARRSVRTLLAARGRRTSEVLPT